MINDIEEATLDPLMVLLDRLATLAPIDRAHLPPDPKIKDYRRGTDNGFAELLLELLGRYRRELRELRDEVAEQRDELRLLRHYTRRPWEAWSPLTDSPPNRTDPLGAPCETCYADNQGRCHNCCRSMSRRVAEPQEEGERTRQIIDLMALLKASLEDKT